MIRVFQVNASRQVNKRQVEEGVAYHYLDPEPEGNKAKQPRMGVVDNEAPHKQASSLVRSLTQIACRYGPSIVVRLADGRKEGRLSPSGVS